MSKYTISIEELIYSITYNSQKSMSDKINDSLPTIFNFNFPLWSDEYKPVLERKILLHYFKNEIGFETVQLWQLYLEERLNLIMPKYNDLYKSIINYDITQSLNITKTNTNTSELNGTNTNDTTTGNTANNETNITDNKTGNTTNTNTNYDIPQTGTTEGDLQYYANNEVKETNNSTNTDTNKNTLSSTLTGTNNTNGTINTTKTDNNTEHESGNNIPIADLIAKYRTQIINIDELIINELKDLFILKY